VRIGRTAGVTDTGRRRMRNEDALVLRPPLFAVADGMGGARAGEVAARLAAAALEEAGTDTMGEKAVSSLIEEANRRIWQRSLADPATAGMGTTVTAALVDATAGTVALGHVGDSRAYRLRGDALEQLSTDHSLVAELVQSGVLTPEEAERHPQRSAITRALGTEPAVEVEVLTVDADVGDLFLLCSDGLSAMLGDEEIAAAIEGAGRDPQSAGEALVAAANAHGGEDNITVVLFELVEGDAPQDEVAEVTTLSVDRAESVPADRPSSLSHEDADVNRHGAGPGGRVAALALIALVVVVGLLALYWGISR
jgi:PPM family protein phosphatase